MAVFRGQTAYFRAATRDVAYGTNVRALLATAAADTSWTVTFTSTTAITQTVNPFTNISNNSADNRTTLGWGFNQNEASTDSVGSGSTVSGITRKRIIPAGVWSFRCAWTSNAPALLASYDVVFSYHVYRVAANGGTRTLLFSANAAATTVRLVGGSDPGNATSASQPAYTLEPNETIHIAVQINSAATSALLGSVTNTVITITGATSGNGFVTLPSPGMRDLYFDSNSAAGEGDGNRSNLIRKDAIFAVGEGEGTYDYLAEFFRAFSAIAEGEGTRALLVLYKTLSAIAEGDGTRALLLSKALQGVGDGIGTRSNLVQKDTLAAIAEGEGTYDYLAEFFRAFAAIAEGDGSLSKFIQKDAVSANAAGIGSISRALELFRSANAEGAGESVRSLLVQKSIITADAVGESTQNRIVTFSRAFDAIAAGEGTMTRVVIFVRSFDSVGVGAVRPRIALDWDDLPDTGSSIINVYRPLLIFDD